MRRIVMTLAVTGVLVGGIGGSALAAGPGYSSSNHPSGKNTGQATCDLATVWAADKSGQDLPHENCPQP